jgi:hypothetical protein
VSLKPRPERAASAGPASPRTLLFHGQAPLHEDAIGRTGPLANAFLKLDGRLGGIGRSHHIAKLRDLAVGGVVAGKGRCVAGRTRTVVFGTRQRCRLSRRNRGLRPNRFLQIGYGCLSLRET